MPEKQQPGLHDIEASTDQDNKGGYEALQMANAFVQLNIGLISDVEIDSKDCDTAILTFTLDEKNIPTLQLIGLPLGNLKTVTYRITRALTSWDDKNGIRQEVPLPPGTITGGIDFAYAQAQAKYVAQPTPAAATLLVTPFALKQGKRYSDVVEFADIVSLMYGKPAFGCYKSVHFTVVVTVA